ncbi:PrpF domain-containing protein [Ammoniphilus resinae]|uniref:2-methylaconitate cis-trans-isomerase PrpF n=1 Tax=Ammoniphilus resinae TaxID=861532 RepID=A0ABS4GVW8_9BACL|nr:2-methylaconitate cis-trans-isomerase PrpF [Ammoniphilus resinae]
MAQFTVPCSVYRGGTSRGLFFHQKDLPQDPNLQRKVFLAGIDAYNVSQVNGLGSGTSHTSKVVVISPPSVEGADVDYTFYQIGIGEEIVDDKGTCGNLMAAVGAFAVDEGLVDLADHEQEMVEVSVFNTNIGKMIKLQVPVIDGKAKVSGDYLMPGVYPSGAKFIVDILEPGGGKTGKTLPLGAASSLFIGNKKVDVSFVDVVNPFVYLSSRSLGIKGIEPNHELSMNQQLLKELEEIRSHSAVEAGMEKTVVEAKLAPAVPKLAIVSEPQDYVTSDGKKISKEEVDIVAKMVSMGRFHRTFAGSGLYNLAAAVLLPGTLPNQLAQNMDNRKNQVVRIGHPEGIAEVRASLTTDGHDVAFVGLERTARRIMKGDLYIPR